MNETLIWHKGPPPHVGWWNASRSWDYFMWRWWDGKQWSRPAFSFHSPRTVAAYANAPDPEQWGIDWTDRYPPGARVPRINPENLK